MDWAAAGFPMEGTLAAEPRALHAARQTVPRCRIHERLGEVWLRVRQAGWDRAVVVDEAGVVLGLVRSEALDGTPDRTVEEVMDGAPSTIRPSVPLKDVGEYIARDADSILVTTPDGILVGVLRREDAERRAKQTAA